jgi:hypothetical protein
MHHEMVHIDYKNDDEGGLCSAVLNERVNDSLNLSTKTEYFDLATILAYVRHEIS